MNKRFYILVILFLLIKGISYSQPTIETLADKYGMNKVYESDIGVYYARNGNHSEIQTLDQFLSSKTDSLERLFMHQLSGKVRFELYPTHATADFACGWDTTSTERNLSRVACAHYINRVQAVMPGMSSTADSVYNRWGGVHKVILHEYIHSFTYDLVGEKRINDIPFLFAEGIAIYFSEQLYFNTKFKEIIFKRLSSNEVPKFQKLIVNSKFINTLAAYHWAFLFTNYIIDTYGWATFLEVIKNFENYRQIMARKDKEINKEWFEYLESNKIEP